MRGLACPAARLSRIFAVLPLPASQSCKLLLSSWLRSKPVLANSSRQRCRQSTAHAAWPLMAPSKLSAHDVANLETTHLGMSMAAAQWRSLSSAESESSNAMSLTSLKGVARSCVSLFEWCCARYAPVLSTPVASWCPACCRSCNTSPPCHTDKNASVSTSGSNCTTNNNTSCTIQLSQVGDTLWHEELSPMLLTCVSHEPTVRVSANQERPRPGQPLVSPLRTTP